MQDLAHRQQQYMEEEWVPPPWCDRTTMTPAADYLWHAGLWVCREEMPADLAPLTMLFVNAGSGGDARFFQVEGAGRLILADISRRAVMLAREHCRGALAVVADTARLPFCDGAVDIAGVRSGLHHLERPHDGLAEMARVARQGLFFVEPHASALVPVFVRLGLAEDREESGNTVYRFTRAEVEAALGGLGFRSWRIVTAIYAQTPPLLELARKVPGRWPARGLRAIIRLANHFVGRWGLSMAVVAWKSEGHAE